MQRASRVPLRRDDRAVGAIMEDLPSFIVITIGVGIFLLSAVSALGAYKEGYDTTDTLESAYAYATRIRADDTFLVPFASHSGQFSYDRILDAQVVANDAKDEMRQLLGVPEHVRVRVLDVNRATCPGEGCELFRFDNKVPDRGGSLMILQLPVTIQYAVHEVHAGVLEVGAWRS